MAYYIVKTDAEPVEHNGRRWLDNARPATVIARGDHLCLDSAEFSFEYGHYQFVLDADTVYPRSIMTIEHSGIPMAEVVRFK